MLEKTKPEAVTGFGTTFAHLEIVQLCAPRGIHVMVEKPLAVSLAHAKEMANLAQKYYHLAFENAKTTKFKALCLRMEDYAKDNVLSDYPKLKSAYPDYFKDLSSCDNLEDYFKVRR